jgi:hypothetical protein
MLLFDSLLDLDGAALSAVVARLFFSCGIVGVFIIIFLVRLFALVTETVTANLAQPLTSGAGKAPA